MDNAATTKVREEVSAEILSTLNENWGNCSGLYSVGEKAKNKLNECRKRVAKVLNCKEGEIFFTSGSSEGNNAVLNTFKRNGNMIITDKIEHKSILNALDNCFDDNFYYYILDVDSKGYINNEEVDRLCQAYDKETDGNMLFSVMYVNNVLGNIINISNICKKVHEVGGYFHTDATQAVGHCSLDVKELGVDYMTISGHKFGAPKGVGVLYVKKGVPFIPLIFGGQQEGGKRAGTENLPYICGITLALEEAEIERCLGIGERYERMFNDLVNYLEILSATKDFPSVLINTDKRNCTHHILNFGLFGFSAESIMLLLDTLGVCVGTGSACTSGYPESNYVLKAINVPKKYLNGCIRVSFCPSTTDEDIKIFVDKLQKSIKMLKEMTP